MKKSDEPKTPEENPAVKAKLYEMLEQKNIIPNEQMRKHIEAYRFITGTDICEIGGVIFISSRFNHESWSLSISPDGSSARGYGLNRFK